MPHAQPVFVNKPIAFGRRAKGPVAILGHPAAKRADIFEHIAPGDQIAGAGKPLYLDILTEIEGEDRLEGLGPAARRWGFVKHPDPPADEIGIIRHPAAGRHPIGRGQAIGIDEHQTGRRGFTHAPVAGGGGAFFRLDNKAEGRKP